MLGPLLAGRKLPLARRHMSYYYVWEDEGTNGAELPMEDRNTGSALRSLCQVFYHDAIQTNRHTLIQFSALTTSYSFLMSKLRTALLWENKP